MNIRDAVELLKFGLTVYVGYKIIQAIKAIPAAAEKAGNGLLTGTAELTGQDWAGQIDKPFTFWMQEFTRPTTAPPLDPGWVRIPGGMERAELQEYKPGRFLAPDYNPDFQN